LAPGADKAVEGNGTDLGPAAAWEDIEVEDRAEDADDILHGARAGAECAVIAKRHKRPGAGKAVVKAHKCEGACGSSTRQ